MMGKLSRQKSGLVTPVQPFPVLEVAMPNQVGETKLGIVDCKSSSVCKQFPGSDKSNNINKSRQHIKDVGGSLVSVGIATAGCGSFGDIYEVKLIFISFDDTFYLLRTDIGTSAF